MKLAYFFLPVVPFLSINRNMRCIEMWGYKAWVALSAVINRNMRCIEIFLMLVQIFVELLINRNMRCIEIVKHYLKDK